MKKESYRFDVEFLEEAFVFLGTLDRKSREKVLENIRISRFKIDPKRLKKIDKEIWEFRTYYSGRHIRLLAFWDKQKGALMVCTHGLVKKTQKLHPKQIERAKSLRREYFRKNNER